MRVLFLADDDFARREHEMLRRMEVGLIAEGFHLVRAVPETIDPDLAGEPTGLDAMIRYERPMIDTPRRFARMMLGHLRECEPWASPGEDGRILDVVHAWSPRLWRGAIELASLTGADLALECWSSEALGAVSAADELGFRLPGAPGRGVWLAPDEVMRSHLERRTRLWPALNARWGAHVPDSGAPASGRAGAAGISILVRGRDSRIARGLLSALARPGLRERELLLFLDAEPRATRSELWTQARRLGLRDRLSLADGMEPRRELVLRTPILALAGADGAHRSLVLDAMAHGMALVAPVDEYIGCLAEGRAMILPPRAAEDDWAAALTRLLDEPDRARALGAAAREYIRAERPAHQQVATAEEVYERLRTKGVPSPIPIRA